MVSLKDIAAKCGVSVSTVSKALNDSSDISEERKNIIRKKAKEMGYFPNMVARALKTNTTYNIGVLFVDGNNSGLTHPYFARVLESLKVEAESYGYDITFINKKLGKHKMTYYEHCQYRNVDGLVVACVEFSDPEVMKLINGNIPVVTIDHIFNGITAVVSDNVKGMHDLLEHVIENGHKKIAYISGKDSSVTQSRLASFYRTLEEHGIKIPDEYVLEGSYLDTKLTETLTKQLLALKERPTCIVFPDDYASIGGINAINEAGLSIPEDISIVGFDGIPISQVLNPKLTTYGQDMNGIGKEAAKRIIEIIEKPKTALRGITVVSGKVIKGESIKNVKKNKN
ncbi:substrate-binding domain-containing protein [Clostridium sediminicola]